MIIKTLIKDLDPTVIEKFASQFRGTIILPAHKEYNGIRKVFNAMIDKHPGMIVRCVDVADVMHAVNFGRSFLVLHSTRHLSCQ
ncbi:hypothetical protein LV84_03222 [Algoriphagus ratkowskyi]|uniref:Uncharacterized protein n=1 Tax=Algoriphagus ratkowskyi TaxID=57028 RepID=A0A2W7QYB5_9BACT|nr:hypothetical protein [Algoriphagus ratkowskyi]PZX53498.1 hypothetical protein LV84_03222 [Algoriphagus ratkowskyi]TXD76469.1 hypothetical protein ESW18_15790 [Algoriphagus ratkowskyi]